MNNSHKTAIKRKAPSAPAVDNLRSFAGIFWHHRPVSLLDYGCGFGADVELYREYDYDAVGFDPGNPAFDQMPTGTFDIVTCTYVLNVINPMEQGYLLDDLLRKLSPKGLLVLAVRTDVERQANKSGWQPEEGGYITLRGTYQRQVDTDALMDDLKRRGCVSFVRGGYGAYRRVATERL
jgi:SAM-dependent methyltransferase